VPRAGFRAWESEVDFSVAISVETLKVEEAVDQHDSDTEEAIIKT
jgi:hypothetical protein